MIWEPSSGALTQLHADERGSIIATSDGGGNVTAINRYDDYGAPQGPGGAGTRAGRRTPRARGMGGCVARRIEPQAALMRRAAARFR